MQSLECGEQGSQLDPRDGRALRPSQMASRARLLPLRVSRDILARRAICSVRKANPSACKAVSSERKCLRERGHREPVGGSAARGGGEPVWPGRRGLSPSFHSPAVAFLDRALYIQRSKTPPYPRRWQPTKPC